MKNVTRTQGKTPKPGWVFKDDVVGKAFEKALVQDHRAHCLQQHAHMSFEWRRASHVVSFRGLGCVNISLTVCDLWYACSGVWMFLIWSVL